MSELKPCPFCGFPSEEDKASGFGEHEFTNNVGYSSPWSVSCGNCGATAPSGECRHEAIDEWNKRA